MFVADYVLMEYGTGAVMGVPAHDQRDHDFAVAFDLPIRPVVAPGDVEEPDVAAQAFTAHTDDERLINSGEFSGMDAAAGRDAIVAWLDREGGGSRLGQLPAARLAGVPAALLGVPDPDRLLPGLWDGSRPGLGPSRGASRDGGLPAPGAFAAGRRRGLGEHQVPGLRARRPARDRHDGHVRRLQLVLPALLRCSQRSRPRGIRAVLKQGGCRSTQYIGGRRARDPAPACTRAFSSRR